MNAFNIDRIISLLALIIATFLPTMPEPLRYMGYLASAFLIAWILLYSIWDYISHRNLLDGQIIFDCKQALLPKVASTHTINTLNL